MITWQHEVARLTAIIARGNVKSWKGHGGKVARLTAIIARGMVVRWPIAKKTKLHWPWIKEVGQVGNIMTCRSCYSWLLHDLGNQFLSAHMKWILAACVDNGLKHRITGVVRIINNLVSDTLRARQSFGVCAHFARRCSRKYHIRCSRKYQTM